MFVALLSDAMSVFGEVSSGYLAIFQNLGTPDYSSKDNDIQDLMTFVLA